jgi:hypothetical protein
MSKVFNEYQDALQKYAARVVAVSGDINDNRMRYNAALAQFEAAVLADQPTVELEKTMAGLNAEYEVLSHKANALNKASGKGSNSFVREAAQKVFKVNQAEILSMKEAWEEKKAALLAMQTQYLNLLVELGALAREASRLREECNLAGADAGLGLAVSALGDELQISRRRGWLFPDHNHVALAYTSGELPRPETTGTVDPSTPRERVPVEQVQPPARQYRRAEKPYTETTFADSAEPKGVL